MWKNSNSTYFTEGVEIVAAFEANASSDTKRSRGGKNVEIDSALLEWFRKARSKNIPISGPILQEKALQIAEVLRSMYFVPLYVAIRDRLISIVPFKFICKCQLKPTSEQVLFMQLM